MSKRTLTLTSFMMGIPVVLGVAWWLVSPLFINRVTNDPFSASTGSVNSAEAPYPLTSVMRP